MTAPDTPLPPLAPLAPAADDTLASARPAGLWRDTLASVLRLRSAVVGLIILAFLAFIAVFAPVITTHDPNQSLLGIEQGVLKREGSCIHVLGCPADQPQHIVGTDGNFRDVLRRSRSWPRPGAGSSRRRCGCSRRRRTGA